MFDEGGSVLYVGKVCNFKNWVSSYFCKSGLVLKIEVLVSKIVLIEVMIIGSEIEVLLFEQNLIKFLWLFYNILLWDDKFYFYIYLLFYSDYLLLIFCCGCIKKGGGIWFGFFLSFGVVKESFNVLQKVFCIRFCSESYFNN